MLYFVLQKYFKFVLCLAKSLPFIYFRIYKQPRYHILYTVTLKNVLPLSQGCKSNKILLFHHNLTFTQIFVKFHFRPSVTCFNIHQKNLSPKYKRFCVLLRKIYFHAFFKMSAYGVKLLTVSLTKPELCSLITAVLHQEIQSIMKNKS